MSAESNGRGKPVVWRRIGRRVRQLREGRDWTLEHLAGLIHTQKGALSLMERGQRDFGSERIRLLAKVLEVDVDAIYGLAGPHSSAA